MCKQNSPISDCSQGLLIQQITYQLLGWISSDPQMEDSILEIQYLKSYLKLLMTGSMGCKI